MQIRAVGTELFCAGGQTDRHDETNCLFSQFCESAENLKKSVQICDNRMLPTLKM
jgi:hypothetical protein